MDLGEFRKELMEEARTTAATDGGGTTAAFASIVADNLIDRGVLPDYEVAFYQGTGFRGRKLRVDGYALDDLDDTMNLVVVRFAGEAEPATLTRSEAEQYFELPLRLVEEAYHRNLQDQMEISTPAADLVDTLVDRRQRIRKFRILLFTDGLMSGRIELLPVVEREGVPVECQIWDMERLWKLMMESGRDAVVIDFTKYVPQGLPCLETEAYEAAPYKCFLAVMPGEVLASVYDEFGARLLEGNVRAFLSTKVAVNKKIRETILTTPDMFFAFNNGISATALGVEVADTPQGKFITGVNEFQIINGGQTTASLSNARYRDKADLERIRVQMKLLDIQDVENDTDALVQAIARSSNSQNKVSDADFFSTHPFHVEMEKVSRRLFAPAMDGRQYDTHWFYERARGQYFQAQSRMSRAERAKFVLQNPKSQVITKTDLAKVLNSWRRLPHVVSKGAQANFVAFAEWVDEQWMEHSDVFNEQFFMDAVALSILFRRIEQIVSHATWYEHGYRANIVTYTLAWLSHLIKRDYPQKALDLNLIWNKQDISQVLVEQLDVLGKSVEDAITDPARGVANVTQWCKQEACWKRIKATPMALNLRIETVLEDLADTRSTNRSARRDQKVIAGIEAQTEVVTLGPEYWKHLREFVNEKRLAGGALLTSLTIACQIPNKLPNSVQSQQLLLLRDKAESEGWRKR